MSSWGRSGPASAPSRAAPHRRASEVVEPEQRGERRVWLRKESQLSVVFIGYPVPNHRSPDAFALEVLSAVLSGGRASRVYQRLVYEEGLALEAGGDYSRLTLDPDTFTFYVTLLPDRAVEEAERALEAELERLRRELISDEELQRAQNQLDASYRFGQDSVFNRAATLARHELLGGWRLSEAYLPGSGPSRARTCGEWPSAISCPSAGRRPSWCRRLRPPSRSAPR